MTYTTSGPTYETVCELIGWDPEIRAIQVLDLGQEIHVAGTLLKPREWRELRAWDNFILPDGRSVVITGVPWGWI